MPDKLVDIHCHILPALDDGSRSLEESMEMLRIAAEEGITDMIATPHYKEGRHNASTGTIRARMARLQEEARRQGIDISLYPGNEIYYFSDLEKEMDAGRILTMAGSAYLLVEFSPTDPFTYIRNAFYDILGMGWKPILAHAERYECMLKDWRNVEELVSMGIRIQVNAASIAGELGFRVKRFVHGLIARKLVHYIGTDAHSSKGRAPRIRKCCKELYHKYDERYVDALLFGNALEMIKYEDKSERIS